ncbi:MAG TPA: MFS transporter [Pseudolysinimonas sp.]|nr:MFS transporter [Pseudolysinimonas sp.]
MTRPGPLTPSKARSETDFPFLPLLALSGGIFVSMTNEFLPGGLIPLIASDLKTSVAEVGLLITAFAGVVVATTIPISWLTRRVSRKPMVVVALAGIGIAALLSALAPTFELLIGTRLFAGLAHGLFWSVAAAYAAHLVPVSQIGRATALTAGGGALAGILGVPLGNLLGFAFGWRLAFVSMTALALIVVGVIIWRLPSIAHRVEVPPGSVELPRRRDPTLPRVLGICLVLVILISGATSYGTYGVVWLLNVAHVPEVALPLVLTAGGVVGFIGLAITGRLSDRMPRALLLGALTVVAGAHLLMPLAAQTPLVLLGLILATGLTWGSVPTLLQAMNMRTASPAIRGFAAAAQTTAINVGIGAGAVLGGLAIGFAGLPSLPAVAGVVIVVAGIVVIIFENAWRRQPLTSDVN